MLKNKLKNLNKKQKLGLFTLSIILLISICSITGVLPLASLFGGDSSNVYGGQFVASATGQSGSTTTSFASSSVDHIDFSITNNANSPYALMGQPYDIQAYNIDSSEAATDYQVKIHLYHQSGMNDDLSNIRFQTSDGTPIPQWRESYSAGSSAIYWVKMDLTTGNNGLYVAYGGDLPLKSDGNKVFEYFDSIENSQNTWSNPAYWSDYSTDSISPTLAKKLYTSTAAASLTNIHGLDFEEHTTMPTSGVIEMNIKDLGSVDPYLNIIDSGTNYVAGCNLYSGRGFFRGVWGATWYGYADSATMFDDSWHKYRIKYTPISTHIQIDDNTPVDLVTTTPVGTPRYLTSTDTSTGKTNNFVIDNIFIRKHMATEPTSDMALGTTLILADGGFPFSHMKTLTIDNSGGSALSGYQHLETVTYESEMQIDMDDILFTETDGTIIPHFTESVTNGVSADVYLKLSADADSSKDIIMYYGNSQIPDLSDSDIFEFYEDFDDLTAWTYEGDVTVSDGIMSYQDVNTGTIAKLYSDETFTYGSELTVHAKIENEDFVSFGFRTPIAPYDGVIFDWDYDAPTTNTANEGTNTQHLLSVDSYDWHDYRISWLETEAKFYIDDGLEGTHTTNMPDEILNIRLATVRDEAGDTPKGEIDYIYVRQIVATSPSISFGSEKALVNPTFTTSCTGDSNEQPFGTETKEFSLTPTSDITQFIVDGSLDYDFTATVYYTGATSVSSQNSTTGDIEFTFTPTMALDEGYANAIFDEDIILEYPEISVTLDGEFVDAVFENNNTVSIDLGATDITEHTVVASITNNPPVIPSSSGGGGGGGGITLTTVEETINETVDTTEILTESDQAIDFNIFNSDTNNLIIYSALVVIILFGIIIYSRQKQ